MIGLRDNLEETKGREEGGRVRMLSKGGRRRRPVSCVVDKVDQMSVK